MAMIEKGGDIMTIVERLEAFKTVDIKDVDRDKLPNYNDLISELDKEKE